MQLQIFHCLEKKTSDLQPTCELIIFSIKPDAYLVQTCSNASITYEAELTSVSQELRIQAFWPQKALLLFGARLLSRSVSGKWHVAIWARPNRPETESITSQHPYTSFKPLTLLVLGITTKQTCLSVLIG